MSANALAPKERCTASVGDTVRVRGRTETEPKTWRGEIRDIVGAEDGEGHVVVTHPTEDTVTRSFTEIRQANKTVARFDA